MQTDIDAFFASDVSAFTRRIADLDRRIGPAAAPRKDEIFQELYDAIYRCLDACARAEAQLRSDPQRLKEVQDRFRGEIAPWFDRSWFMQRAKVKPRGYPGDYETLTGIYDGLPKSVGIGGYLDLFFLGTILGRAVPARIRAARAFLIAELARRGTATAVNVACGPCREYTEDWKPAHPGNFLRVACIDSDRQALDFVEARLAAAPPEGVEVQCVSYNALRMGSAKANVAKFGRPDILYSVGLCDYIPDKFMIPMLRGWRETVADGGVVYVAFKDSRRYPTEEYQWLVDWFFLQRTEEDCRRLFAEAGYDVDGMEMTRDATGAIMNFVSRVKAPAVIRVDQAEGLREGQPAAARHAPVQHTS